MIILKKCSLCDEKSVIYLPYCRREMCKTHFTRMFEKRFRDTVRLGKMISKDDRVAVAVSGGKDSLVLLHSLSKLSEDFPFELVALSIDEGIKGYRKPLIEKAEKECRKLSIEHMTASFEEEAGFRFEDFFVKKKRNPCSYCGTIRRYVLNRIAKRIGADSIATGHHLNDVVQTFLMNIMRNEPFRIGRGGRAKFFVKRIRPLEKTPEREIVKYSRLNGIPASRKRCPYAPMAFREHMRGIVRETEEKYPDTLFRVYSSMKEIEKAMKKQGSSKKTGVCSICGSPTTSGKCKFCTILSESRKVIN